MVQVGLSFSDALQTYTVLTIGDGLVGNLPALIVSGAAGLLITRVSPEEESEELANQLQSQMFGDIQPWLFWLRRYLFCLFWLNFSFFGRRSCGDGTGLSALQTGRSGAARGEAGGHSSCG